MEADKCERCGKCCHYYKDSKVKPCQFLVRLPGGKTLCRVYETRNGRIIDTDGRRPVICGNREDSPNDYPGCPYNAGRPLFEKG